MWLTRVPEAITEAKRLVASEEQAIDWKQQENGYKTSNHTSSYGDCEQRWMLVYSEKAYQRESATFEKKLARQAIELEKSLRRLGKRKLNCPEDAQGALNEFNKPLRYFDVKASIVPMMRYVSRGRPGENSETVIAGYKIQGQLVRDQSAIETALNTKGRFIPGTNELDEENYSDEQMPGE